MDRTAGVALCFRPGLTILYSQRGTVCGSRLKVSRQDRVTTQSAQFPYALDARLLRVARLCRPARSRPAYRRLADYAGITGSICCRMAATHCRGPIHCAFVREYGLVPGRNELGPYGFCCSHVRTE